VKTIAIDFETANEQRGSACSVGLAWIEDGQVTRVEERLIRPRDMRFSGMNIAIHGIRPDTTLGARVSARLETVLAALRVSPISAKATFFDDDGPKGGPAIRCAISVRVPYRPLIRVEHISTTGRLAFEGAFATLERQLERYRERVRDIKRRPKKYFVAKRLLAESPLPPSKAARLRRRKVS